MKNDCSAYESNMVAWSTVNNYIRTAKQSKIFQSAYLMWSAVYCGTIFAPLPILITSAAYVALVSNYKQWLSMWQGALMVCIKKISSYFQFSIPLIVLWDKNSHWKTELFNKNVTWIWQCDNFHSYYKRIEFSETHHCHHFPDKTYIRILYQSTFSSPS